MCPHNMFDSVMYVYCIVKYVSVVSICINACAVYVHVAVCMYRLLTRSHLSVNACE